MHPSVDDGSLSAAQTPPIHRRLTLIACIIGSGIAFLDGTLVNVALPAISQGVGGGLAGQLWVVDSYLLALGALVLIGGSLGDLLGRRRMFALGVAAFGVCSCLCAAAPTIEALIAFRLLEGAAGAVLVPNSLALIADTFAPRDRAGAIGSWTSWTGVATVAGPLIGGAIVGGASWRWIFLVNGPPVLAVLWLLRYAPAGTRRHDVKLDWLGGALCALGLGLLTFALIKEPSDGWEAATVLFPALASVAVLVIFVVHESSTADPMIPLGLFRTSNFAGGNLVTLLLYGAVSAATFFLVIFLQQVRGLSALEAGAVLLPTTVVIFLLAKRFGALADRIGARRLMTAGPLIGAGGLAWLLALPIHGPYLGVVIPATTLFGLGLAISVAPLTSTVMGAVREEHDGIASGINNALARVGGLAAIAGIGALLAARFSAAVNASLSHAGAAAREAALKPLSVDTYRFALHDRPQAHVVLEHASLQALQAALIASTGLAAAAGVAAAIWIRDPPRPRGGRGHVAPIAGGRSTPALPRQGEEVPNASIRNLGRDTCKPLCAESSL